MPVVNLFLMAREDPEYSFARGHKLRFNVELIVNIQANRVRSFERWFERFVGQNSQGLPFVVGREDVHPTRQPIGVRHAVVDIRGRKNSFATSFLLAEANENLRRISRQ